MVAALSEAHELQDDVLRQVGAMFDPEHLPAMPGTVADMPHMADEESRVTVQLLAPPGTGPAMAALPHMPAFPATLQDGMQTATVGKRDYRIWVRTLANGQRIAKLTPSGGADIYLNDHLGSARVMARSGWSANYYPFGEVASQTGSNVDTRFDFTGQERDEGTGLMYYVGRFYDPVIGRFISVDPLASQLPGWSPYHYTFDNPINFIDPTGLMPEDDEIPEGIIESLSQFFDFSKIVDKIEVTLVDAAKKTPAAAGQLALDAAQAVVPDPKTAVQMTGATADFVSDASTGAAIGGILAAPFTGGSSLSLTAMALQVGTVADITSTAAKTTEALVFDGSTDAAVQQGAQTLFNIGAGRAFRALSGQVITRTSSSFVRPLFRSAQSGRFVTNNFGFTVTAAADATIVTTSIMTSLRKK